MYAQYSPAFSFVAQDDKWTAVGGLFWDGRANSLSEQAGAPFLNPREMALSDKADLVERVRRADYAKMFDFLFGSDALGAVEQGCDQVTQAIAAFERTPAFAPFSSKFDAYLRGDSALSEQEALGFELFKDKNKGNCLECHVGDADSADPQAWLFTNFTYDVVGVPRNTEISDNADANYFDLGLCASQVALTQVPRSVTDKHAFIEKFCGAFKVPTLRNVAKTAPYMHNGYFKNLRDVVDFYVTRDTDPRRWYAPSNTGSLQSFDDMPEPYRSNVNKDKVPYSKKMGEGARLSPSGIDAVVAFLQTLDDGYRNTP
jgi:cytochrome c peroxidase